MSTSRRTVIVDLLSGRLGGGHHEMLLHALERTFAGDDLETIAPYTQGRAGEPLESLGGLATSFRAFRRGLQRLGHPEGVLVAHSPAAVDFVTCWLAAHTIRAKNRNGCLMVLRRDPVTISRDRHRWLGRAFERLVARMIRTRLIHIAADSAIVRDSWTALVPGSSGSVVGVPPLPTVSEHGEGIELIRPGGPLVGLVGEMRAEKGAALYPAIAEAVLETLPGSGVIMQIGGEAAGDGVSDLLRRNHSEDPRVQLIEGEVSDDDYAKLLRSVDVVVMPYDVVAYGGASSGILSDALSAGAVVISTKLPWAEANFGGDSRVVWLEDPADRSDLASSLDDAAVRLEASAQSKYDGSADFADSWLDAARAAQSSAQRPAKR